MSASGFVTTWLERERKMPAWVFIPIGVLLLSAVGLLDWVTGAQVALSLLYVAPITWMTSPTLAAAVEISGSTGRLVRR